MNIIGFMLAVLGSNIFWICYGIATIFIAGALMRKIAPASYKFVTTGRYSEYHEDDGFEKAAYCWITFLNLVFWPFVILGIAFWYFILLLFSVVGKGLGWAFKSSEKLVPDISVKVKR